MAVLKRTNMSSIFVMCTQISSRLVKKKKSTREREENCSFISILIKLSKEVMPKNTVKYKIK